MDNTRPSLDMQYFNEICPDKNGLWLSLPVICFRQLFMISCSPSHCSIYEI
jgi:hypothetical protein